MNSFNYIIKIILIVLICSCSGNKNVCLHFRNESNLKIKNVNSICDSLASLKMQDKFLYFNLSNPKINQIDRNGISKTCFSNEFLNKGAIIFFYRDSKAFDIIFSDSLRSTKFLINRMNFVKAIQSHRNEGINSVLFLNVINEFKKIDAE